MRKVKKKIFIIALMLIIISIIGLVFIINFNIGATAENGMNNGFGIFISEDGWTRYETKVAKAMEKNAIFHDEMDCRVVPKDDYDVWCVPELTDEGYKINEISKAWETRLKYDDDRISVIHVKMKNGEVVHYLCLYDGDVTYDCRRFIHCEYCLKVVQTGREKHPVTVDGDCTQTLPCESDCWEFENDECIVYHACEGSRAVHSKHNYTAPTDDCTKLVTCSNKNCTQTGRVYTSHNFPETTSCTQESKCTRCNVKDGGISHRYWTDDCTATPKCLNNYNNTSTNHLIRCSATYDEYTTETQHKWARDNANDCTSARHCINLTYQDDGSGTLLGTIGKCKITTTIPEYTSHSYAYTSCTLPGQCTHNCQAKDYSHVQADHNWETVTQTTDDGLFEYEITKCSSCVALGVEMYKPNTGVKITAYKGSQTEIIIPSTIKGLTVTSIGNGAFAGRTQIENVTIPEGVTEIGNRAFSTCIALKNITLPENLQNIGKEAFYQCRALTEITIHENVKEIKDRTFSECYKLNKVTLPSKLEKIGNYAFDKCNITEITIPNSVVTIGHHAFAQCDITEITIPNSVVTIGYSAFYRCGNLTTATINASKEIEDDAFYGCTNLTTVTIKSCKNIGDSVFYDCTNLSTITLPSNLETIGASAFTNCSSLELISIPNSPTGCTTLGKNVFSGCKNLSNVTLPDTLYTIPERAFYSCEALTNIIIPYNVNKIEKQAFENCSKLEYITFNNTESAKIGEYAPSTKDINIGEQAFRVCTSLKNIYFSDKRIVFGQEAFYGCFNLQRLSLPDRSHYISDNAFKDCLKIENVELGQLTYLGTSAFENNIALKAVNIPSSLGKIGTSAFKNCEALKSITLDEGINEIGANAFDSCAKIFDLYIPRSVTTIGEGAFNNCTNLYAIQIPATVTNIGRNDQSYEETEENVFVNYSEDFAIYCEENSAAHLYAEAHDIPYYLTIGIESVIRNPNEKTSSSVQVTIKTKQDIISDHTDAGWSKGVDENGNELQNVLIKTFNENKTEDIELSANYLEAYRLRVTVDNIDNIGPEIESVTYNGYSEEYLNKLTSSDIKVVISANEEVQPVEGWTLSENKLSIEKTYTANTNGTEEIVLKDLAGNISKPVYINIQCIDKTPLEIHKNYTPSETTHGNVVVSITANRSININSSEETEWIKNEETGAITKTYTENITGDKVTVEDELGNVEEITVDVSNIDKNHIWQEATCTSHIRCKTVNCEYHEGDESQPLNPNNHINQDTGEAYSKEDRQDGYLYCSGCGAIVGTSGDFNAEVFIDPSANVHSNVTVTIKPNRTVQKIYGWTLNDDGTLSKTTNVNYEEKVTLTDLLGNTKEVQVVVSNIHSEHDMEAATCVSPRRCKMQGCTYTEGEVDLNNHDLTAYELQTDATTNELYLIQKCKREGCTYESKYGPLKEDENCTHEVTVPFSQKATCTETGKIGRICVKCGKFIVKRETDMLEHVYTIPATCTSKERCENCKQEKPDGNKDPNNHKDALTGQAYGEYLFEGYYHCKGCDSKLREQEETHDPNHTHVFIEKILTKATCTTAGEKQMVCKYSNCNETNGGKIVIPALGHSYTIPATCISKEICERCKEENPNGNIDPQNHNYAKYYIVTKDPTETEEGLQDEYCSGCTNKIATKPIAPKGEAPEHKHDMQTVITNFPTCTEEGEKDYKCTYCEYNNDGKYKEKIPALGHKYTIEATCSSNERCERCREENPNGNKNPDNHKDALTGEKYGVYELDGYYRCSGCHSPLEKIVPGGPEHTHVWITKVLEEATCTETGRKQEQCKYSDCDATKGEIITIPAKGHEWQEATCTTPKTCSVCKTTEGEALGHKWQAATCTTPKTCSVCKTTEGVALEHSYTIAATCTSKERCENCKQENPDGNKDPNNHKDALTGQAYGEYLFEGYYYCKGCDGKLREQEETHDPNHTHVFIEKILTKATCTTAGEKQMVCKYSNCNETNGGKIVIPAKGHEWQEATCTTPKTCSVCKTTEGVALGHSYTIAATCSSNERCERCREENPNGNKNPENHNYAKYYKVTKEPTETEEGMQDEYCSGCNTKIATKPIAKKGEESKHTQHDMQTIVTKFPTCLEKGEKDYKCTYCGYNYDGIYKEEIPALGHSYTIEATCKLKERCERCNEENPNGNKNPENHAYATYYIITKAPTETESGERQVYCQGCNKLLRTETINKQQVIWKGDVNKDTNGDGIPDINIDIDGDGIPDINIDIDGDGKPDINIDIDGDGKADINIDVDGDGKPDINIDNNGDGKPDINIDIDWDGLPDINIDIDGDGKPDINVDVNGDGRADINIDIDGDGKADINIDINGDGKPDISIDTNGDGKPDINIDIDGDGVPDINIDKNGDGRADINIDIDGDGKPDINIDINGDGKPDISIDTNGDGKPDINVDTNGDGKPDINVDVNGDGKADVNIDIDGDGKPDINIDTNGDGKPDISIDTNGDGKPDVGVDIDGDGVPDINIDINGDGRADINIDIDGDGKPDINIDTDKDGKPDINIDTNGDGKPDVNIDIDGDGIPDINIDTNGDGRADLNIDTNGDGIPDVNIDTDGDGDPDENIRDTGNNIDTDGDGVPDINIDIDGDGKADINIDTNGDGKPDVNVDTDGDGKADINVDTDGDGRADINIDTDGDGKADINVDTDRDGKADINIDTNGDGKPDVNVDTDGDGKADINVDTDGDGRADINIDTDGDGKADINVDTDGDGKPDINIDTDGDGKADINVDTDGDGKADINVDTDGDGRADINIDTDGDGKADINVDTDGDGKADINIDTNGDGKADLNIDTDGDGKADINVDTDGDGRADINIDTDGDGKADINIDTDGDGKPDLNVDVDGDGKADINIDTDGDGKPDKNIDKDGDGIVDIDKGNKPEDNKPENNKPEDNTPENNKPEDNTIAPNPIPQTGISIFIIIVIIVTSTFGTVRFVQYKKMK